MFPPAVPPEITWFHFVLGVGKRMQMGIAENRAKINCCQEKYCTNPQKCREKSWREISELIFQGNPSELKSSSYPPKVVHFG